MVRDFQRVIGDEARSQFLEDEGSLPDLVIACVGGGSNALGIFTAFLDDDVRLLGVEAEGGATLARGRPGVLHGAYSNALQSDQGQIAESHSISAGLDYPGVGPEHAWLHETGRVRYSTCGDAEALVSFRALARAEGILPALESAHAIAAALRETEAERILVNLSGRGDKDLETVIAAETR
jgi:tryptophan synthase beta chain